MKGRNKTNKYFCSLWMFTILLNTLQLLKRGEWGGGGRGGGYISGLCPVLKQKVLQELKIFGNFSWIPF